MTIPAAAHWARVHSTKGEQEVSWFEDDPALSIRMLEAAGLTPATCVIDVGGGASRLVDALLARGLTCLAVLDVSAASLDRARARLGDRASTPLWIEADVTGDWSSPPMDIWHDRALFHFLTEPQQRDRYRRHLLDTVKIGGSAIIATFAPDGPSTCSGLPVMRYSPGDLARELGAGVSLADSQLHVHVTPWGAPQSFQYSHFRRVLS